MIQINDFEIHMPEDINAKYCVYTIKFEKDSKLYVGHTTNRPLINSVTSTILNATHEGSQNYQDALSQAIRENKSITVEILAKNILDLKQLFHLKYKAILNNKTFIPYGYNKIKKSGPKHIEEKAVIEELLEKEPSLKKHGSSKGVYMVNPKTGESTLFESIAEAAKFVKGHPSNISLCCKGSIATAYGFEWYPVTPKE